ncbi:MAG: hypothetical protein PVS3B3_33460 [Ktedonobacteraceae bacterium]
MIETPTIQNENILHVPSGQWFAPKVTSLGQLITLVQSRYERHDGATLETRGQFLFRWQIAEREEPMNATDTTINWSNLTPAMRDHLVATYVIRETVKPLPRYTQSMDAAWQVVERITDATVTITNVPGAYHHARIKPFAPQRAHHGFRLNAAEAICVAALRAAGLTIIHSEEDIINLHRDLAND